MSFFSSYQAADADINRSSVGEAELAGAHLTHNEYFWETLTSYPNKTLRQCRSFAGALKWQQFSSDVMLGVGKLS